MAEHEEKDDGGEFQVVPKRKAARLRKMVETEDGKMKIVDVPRKPRETATHRAQKRTHNEMSSESIEDDTLPKRRPYFPPLKRTRRLEGNEQIRKIPVFANRLSPLREHWLKIFTPLVEHLKLQVRFNTRTKNVEIRNSPDTEDENALQKAADFVRAFTLGFDVEDALALLRLDDLFIESFEIQDVKPLKGDHLSRAIGRLAGKGGKTKFTIENVTKTRIVLADRKIRILGSYQNIALARRAICSLILGSPPSKVYGNLRTVASRMRERF